MNSFRVTQYDAFGCFGQRCDVGDKGRAQSIAQGYLQAGNRVVIEKFDKTTGTYTLLAELRG